jgi:uncharacterized protein
LLHYWFLLPLGIAIATLVMSAGVSGATLWVPVYLLWLRLDVATAFWLGLLTMLFGFGSGVYRNWRDRSYDGPLVRGFMAASVPAALVGGWAAALVNERVLVGGFGLFLFAYAMVLSYFELRARGEDDDGAGSGVSYPIAIVGGLLTGLISIGVGIVAMPSVLRHRSIHTPGAGIGSLVIIIFFTSLAATIGRLRPAFVDQLARNLPELAAILLWAAPAVVIGGQIGPRIAQLIPSKRHARLYFSAVLLVVGALTLARARG